MEKVLITGISGGQGRLLARRLKANFEVCGVDRVASRQCANRCRLCSGGEPLVAMVKSADSWKRHDLAASDGLNRSSIGKVKE